MRDMPFKPPCIQIPEWSTVAHGFFGMYDGQDPGLEFSGGNDRSVSSEDILRNRTLALHSLGLDGPGFMPKQEHTPIVLRIPEDADNMTAGADALVTKEKNRAIGLLTADCAPVLFYDPVMQIIGAAHAGWRGATGGILENTIKAMFDLGARPDTLQAAIGPTIQKQSYPVSLDFIRNIQKQTSWDITPMTARVDSLYYFDLPLYVQNRLCQEIRCIHNTDINTFGANFFSHRYSLFQHNDTFNANDVGRNMSWIGLKQREQP